MEFENSGLLFGSNDKEVEIIAILLSENFLIQDINLSGSSLLFQKREDLLQQSLIELLNTQNIDTKSLIDAFKLSQKSLFKHFHLESPALKKSHHFMITSLNGMPLCRYAVTIVIVNYSYRSLKSYINSIINNLPGAVYWKDLEGHYLGCNKFVAQMAGYENPEEMLGKTDYDFCWNEFADEWRSLDNAVAEKNTTIQREEKVKLNNGEIRTELTFKSPLKNAYGEIVGIIGTSLDITERKEMESELKKTKEKAEAGNYIMTEFISNMGHMLVTPFSEISGTATQLLYGYSDLYLELKPLFEELMHGCSDWEKVYRKIINSTSLAEIEVKLESFSLNKELKNIVSILKAAASAKNLKLIFKPFKLTEDDSIVTDVLKLHLILIELIANAIKFTEKGRITVSISKENGWYHIQVADSGIGIPSDKLDYIFKQYTMLSRAQKHGTDFKGIGAGLFLAKQRAQLIDGKILVTSELNKGSIFTLSLPVNPK